MKETPEEETARLMARYIEARNAAAHECLAALLDGRHEGASELLRDYQMLAMACESAYQICSWFDNGTAAEHIDIWDA
jgi:hypothetical protein